MEQVNKALSQIDSVTQNNAAAAEEAASASEQLSAQAEMMKRTVNRLVALVGGEASSVVSIDTSASLAGYLPSNTPETADQKRALTPKRFVSERALPSVTKAAQGSSSPQQEKGKKSKEVIPLDADEFEDF